MTGNPSLNSPNGPDPTNRKLSHIYFHGLSDFAAQAGSPASRMLQNPNAQVLLQSGAGGARTLIKKAVHNPVTLISQAPVKALATITASGFDPPEDEHPALAFA